MSEETQNCRGCGKLLIGKYPYAYDPKTKKDAKWNYYGGFVCSEACDVRASLELEQSMPGHGSSQKYISQAAKAKVKSNWG